MIELINFESKTIDELFKQSIKLHKLNDNVYWFMYKNHNYVLKIYNYEFFFDKEKDNLTKLIYVNNVPKLKLISTNEFKWIIMTKIEGIDLFDYIHTYGWLSERKGKNMLYKLIYLVKNIHSLKVVHGDIKPENIIYNPADRTISLIDFDNKFTDQYCSPQQLYTEVQTMKDDIWCIATSFCFCIYGCIIDKSTPKIKGAVSKKMNKLLTKMLETDANSRYDCDAVLYHAVLY